MGRPSSSSAHPIANPIAKTVAGGRNLVAMGGFGVVCAKSLFDFILDIRSRSPTTRERRCRERCSVIGAEGRRLGACDAGERPFCAPIAELAHRDLVRLQVQELEIAEPGRELTRQVARVFLAALEYDPSACVGGKCLASRRRELAQVLVGQDQPEVVTAGLYQNILQALRQVQIVLELVEVKAEVV